MPQNKNDIYVIEGTQEELELLHKALCRLVAVHTSKEERVDAGNGSFIIRKLPPKSLAK